MKNWFNKDYYVIAEIGVNFVDIAKKEWISLLDAAKLMIRKAKEWGAQAAKFQAYKAEKLASKYSPAYWDTSCEPTKSQFELFKKFDSLNPEDYKELANYCEKVWIDFMATPFDLEAVDFLEPLMKYFKVASADITFFPLLKKIAKTWKPILLSTGASEYREIKEAINFIERNGNNKIAILHCVLSYPTKFEDANLKRIKFLNDYFGNDYIVWYSDHTLPDKWMSICTAAFSLWARIIEKHFTLDKNLPGNDHYHAMDINDLKILIENLNNLSKAFSKFDPDYLEAEKVARLNARRSIVLKRNMNKWEVISENDITFKRPGYGISPKDISKVLNKRLNKNKEKDSILFFDDIER